MMKKWLSGWLICWGVIFLVAAPGEALELRRPYSAALAVSYGYDNDGGAAGCKDYACGSICYNGHGGNDFPLGYGTTVLAGADGTVVATNNGCADYGSYGNTCGGRCGNYVRIRHSNGDTTLYCHMRRNSLQVSTGQTVSCGQNLGQSASSGSSTGPHLHLGWNPGGGAAIDVYSGSCNSSPGAWRQQNNYGQPPGASCGCTPTPEVCDGKDNDCDNVVDNGDVCEIDLLHEMPDAYSPARTTDVDGDGIQDLCARFYSGFRCILSTGAGWGDSIASNLMAEENGWGAARYYATIRMGDVDGDGLADVCARHSQGFSCWRSTGSGFEEFGRVSQWNNDGGWDKPQYYTTMRLADINGDGRDDVCARGASGYRCHLSTADGFGPAIHGPEWSNARGHNQARYYGTVRTGDINGDGQDEVCMREQEGFVCYRFTGEGFEHLTTETTMTDANGWGNIIYWPSIRLADIDGDGRKALCARNSTSLFCQRFDGEKFGPRLVLGGLSNDSGWADPTNYATLRVGDVTGDGSEDLCIRANARMLCYSIDGEDVTRFDGPEWSDGAGWQSPSSHGPLFITNLDGEAPGALCGRSPEGFRCERYVDGEFQAYPDVGDFTNGGGWSAQKYYSTIRIGQGVCRDGRCEEEIEVPEEPEESEDPEEQDQDDDGGGGVDTGLGEDTGHDDGSDGGRSGGSMSTTTSSCAAVTGGVPGGGFSLMIMVMVGWFIRRRRRLAASVGMMMLVALVGCERSEIESEPREQAESVAAESMMQRASGGDERIVEHELLAVHGDLRVHGELVPIGVGTDGPRRYRPALLDGDQVLEWPIEVEVITEAALMGEGAELFVVGLDQTLRSEEGVIIARGVTSQLGRSADGGYLAYILEDERGQVLEVYEIETGKRIPQKLGYSMAWAPAVSPGGERVMWAASPEGVPAMLIAIPGDDAQVAEPMVIVNEGKRDADDLDPFPTGPFGPMWTPEGVVFEDQGALYLIDATGEFLGRADASAGYFWDEARGELVDHYGAGIEFE